MSALLYARVSTGEQAERDLSIPAQLHALRRRAVDQRWAIAGEYQDDRVEIVGGRWEIALRPEWRAVGRARAGAPQIAATVDKH